MAYDDSNIFAMILAGKIPNQTVYEDDDILAFNDVAPQTPVHVLVIPKGNFIDLDDFTDNAGAEAVGHFFERVGHIARELGLHDSGYRLVSNNGANAGQIVPHFHVHIMGGRKIKEGSMARGL